MAESGVACRAAGFVVASLLSFTFCGGMSGGRPALGEEEVTVQPVLKAEDGPTEEPLSPEAQHRAMIVQQAAQFEPLLRRQLTADLELLRTLQPDLPAESRRGIAAAGERAVKEAAMDAAESMHAQQQPQAVAVNDVGDLANGVAEFINGILGVREPASPPRRRPDKGTDPFEHIRAALVACLNDQVGEEAGAEFARELSDREQRRRQAVVRRLVAVLDENLFLSPKQREEITVAIGEDWREGLAMAAENQWESNGRKIYLGLPYERVLPLLSDAQRDLLGDGKESRDMEQANRWHLWQTRLWRQMHMGQPVEMDPWWSE